MQIGANDSCNCVHLKEMHRIDDQVMLEHVQHWFPPSSTLDRMKGQSLQLWILKKDDDQGSTATYQTRMLFPHPALGSIPLEHVL